MPILPARKWDTARGCWATTTAKPQDPKASKPFWPSQMRDRGSWRRQDSPVQQVTEEEEDSVSEYSEEEEELDFPAVTKNVLSFAENKFFLIYTAVVVAVLISVVVAPVLIERDIGFNVGFWISVLVTAFVAVLNVARTPLSKQLPASSESVKDTVTAKSD